MRVEPDGTRPGATLIELLAALTLLSLIMTLVVGTCVAQLRLARTTAARAAATDAARSVITVMAGEARRMTADDVLAFSADSLAVRAFRGVGLPCGTSADGVLVRYAGDRLPDPAKDSVLVVTAGASAADVLLATSPAPGMCTSLDTEVILEWRLAAAVPAGSVLLLFESGSYHLSGRALRYRIGAGGRQPLTAEVLSDARSRFGSLTRRAITFEIEAHGLRYDGAAPFAFVQDLP